MKKSYSFCTDEKLRINWFEDGFPEFAGCERDSKGRKYHEVFPKITAGKRDAVRMVISGGMEMVLKSFCLRFPNSQFFADVVIRPLKPGRKGWSGETGAIVTVYPGASCQLAKQLHNYQPLIDIGKMASMLAHGVRNPLNAIKGAVVYLRERYQDEKTLLEFTKLMEEEISRLDNFISRFLSASIAEMGQEVDINPLMKKIEVFVSLQALAHGIKSEFRYAPRLPAVVINPFQLEQAVLNVINNAIEAMEQGGRLEVCTLFEAGKNSQEQDFVVISIADTGTGILGGANERPPAMDRGKGFGLFLTREILRYYGGLLQIKSQKGAGTKVRLCIPAGRADGLPDRISGTRPERAKD